MIHEAMKYVDAWKIKTAFIKSQSPIYPDLFKQKIGKELFVSTLVHWEYNGILFSRHHLECATISDTCTEDMVISRLAQSAEQCKKMAIPCEFDDVVKVLDPNNKK